MNQRRLFSLAIASLLLFVTVNGISYFVRSDGYGLLDVNDGIVRIGYPFLMCEHGGFVRREFFSLSAAFGNVLATCAVVAIVSAAKTRSWRSK
jgi:hypothetical protein